MTVQEQLDNLEARLTLIERQLELMRALSDSGVSLAKSVRELESTLQMVLLKNQEVTDTLAELQAGRTLRPKEPGQ